MVVVVAPQPIINEVNFIDLDPRIEPGKERLKPIEDLKEVLIGSLKLHTTNLGISMTEAREKNVIALLKRNKLFFGPHLICLESTPWSCVTASPLITQ